MSTSYPCCLSYPVHSNLLRSHEGQLQTLNFTIQALQSAMSESVARTINNATTEISKDIDSRGGSTIQGIVEAVKEALKDSSFVSTPASQPELDKVKEKYANLIERAKNYEETNGLLKITKEAALLKAATYKVRLQQMSTSAKAAVEGMRQDLQKLDAFRVKTKQRTGRARGGS